MSKESVKKVIAVPKSMRWSRKNHLLASLLASNSAIFENFAYDPSRKRWAPEFAFWRMHSTSFGQKNWMGFPKSLFLTVCSIGGGGGVFITIWRFNCYFLSLLGTFHACFLAYIECRSTTKWGLVRLAASPLRIFVGALRINLPICLFLDCSIVLKINWTYVRSLGLLENLVS